MKAAKGRVAGVLMLALLLIPVWAMAQGGGGLRDLIGRWTGANQNSLFTAEGVVLIRAPDPEIDGVTFSGKITIRDRSGGRAPVILSLEGQQTGPTGRGQISYTGVNGEPRVLEATTGVGEGYYSIAFQSGEFGPFNISLFKTVDISGVWLFPDGNTMTITEEPDGSFVGKYTGTAASGHPSLSGTLSGTFDPQSGVWDGLITIAEGDVFVTGRFLIQRSLPQPSGPIDETLEGTLTTSNNIEPDVVVTNPIKLTRGVG